MSACMHALPLHAPNSEAGRRVSHLSVVAYVDEHGICREGVMCYVNSPPLASLRNHIAVRWRVARSSACCGCMVPRDLDGCCIIASVGRVGRKGWRWNGTRVRANKEQRHQQNQQKRSIEAIIYHNTEAGKAHNTSPVCQSCQTTNIIRRFPLRRFRTFQHIPIVHAPHQSSV
jgi:hypothetical protein